MQSTSPLGLPTNTLSTELKREDIIRHINQIGDVFTMALRNNLDDSSFETVAGFSAEIIPHTVNGYQRFLDTITKGTTGRVIAGFVIRFKCLLELELGTTVLDALAAELITLPHTQVVQAENGDAQRGGLSLWGIAHADLADVRPPTARDLLVTYLLLLQVKNLLVRASAQAEIEKNTPKK